MNAAQQPPASPRRLGPVIALFGVFLLPIVGTALLQLFPAWIPQARTNHGVLLQPTPELPALALTDSHDQPRTTEVLHGKWQLLWLARAQCASLCPAVLPALERIQLALGKDTARTAVSVLLMSDQFSPPMDRRTANIFTVPAGQRDSLLTTLQAPATGDVLYIVDPAGHAVLRYALDAEPKGILKDLERLLKYSWLG